jgi:hypothetical protein
MPYHHHLHHNPQPNYYDYHDYYLKSKSTVTNLLTYLNEISPLVTSQPPVDTICIDLSSAFGFVLRCIF